MKAQKKEVVPTLEVKKDEQKIRVGLKQTKLDPLEYFKDKKINDVITVKVISSDNKGLTVRPEGAEIDFVIKKSQIAINSADARPSRFVGGERIDVAISENNIEKRKISLSIKLLEELQNKEAITNFSSPFSGKNLPFSSLSDKLKKNKENSEEQYNLAIVKSKILNHLSDNYPNFLKKDLSKLIEIILTQISSSLEKNERVELRDIFILDTRIQKPRISRNPKSNEKVNVPEKKTVHFKMSKKWFNKLNNE